MAETVGQHSVAAFTSPVNGTTPIDANTVRGNDNTVRSAYVDHDADPGIHVQSSSLASRPTAGTAGRKWITVSSGRYQLWYDDGSRWNEVASDAINVDCLADANLAKGDVVKITGFNNGQNLPTVNKVSASTDTAFGVVENTVTSGNIVQIVNTGIIEDVDTNGYAVGTILYPNTSGGWTSTKPTSGNYQPAGYVLRGNTNSGVLYVEFSAPRIVERSDNTASTIVLRDASGNFAAGTITAGAVTSTGLVTFASLKGTGATTVTNILDEDNMASDSATALATQQSIKAYVDAQVATVDTLAEVLANGNTTGANNIIVTNGQKITTNTIDETTAAAGVTIDSVLLKDNAVTATTFNGTLNGAAPAGSLSGTTLASNVVSSSLTSVGTLANLTVTNPISGSVTGSSGSTTGNAATATALQTARNINGVSFNGTADITVTAAAGTLTGTTLASGVTASSLTSVGTLTSLTVSGDLTVDTSTLKVDSTNNRVGILTASPAYALDLASGIARFDSSGGDGLRVYGGSGTNQWDVYCNSTNLRISDNTGGGSLVVDTGATIAGNLAVDTNTLYVDAANNRVGVGTASPVVPLEVVFSDATTTATNSGACFAYAVNTDQTNNNYALTAYADAAGGASSGLFGLQFTNHASNYGDFVWLNRGTGGYTEKMRLDSSGNLGLGVTPSAWETASSKALQFTGGSIWSFSTSQLNLLQNAFYNTSGNLTYINNAAASAYRQISGVHSWYTAGAGTGTITFTQAMTLDADGDLGIGTTSPSEKLHVSGNIRIADTYSLLMGAGAEQKIFAAGSANNTYLTFNQWTGAAYTERARITAGGYFKASDDGTYVGSTGSYHEFNNSTNNVALIARGRDASMTSTSMLARAVRSANSAYSLFEGDSGDGADREFQLRGDGNGYADGTWNNNGADYAEYFESATGEALTVGATVVLDGNKVREATASDPASAVMGVVRPKAPGKASMVVGNTAWNKWSNKYLTDDFDCYVMEDHEVVEWTDAGGKFHSYESHRIPADVDVPEDAVVKTHDDAGNKFQHYKLNPDYDPSVEYVPREKRDEWVIIGLVGQVKVLKGQPVNDRWVKMRDVSTSVEEWMIR